MTHIGSLAAALAAGLCLGVFFFGGLWWTVRHGLSTANPALWFTASTLTRMAVLMLTFYVIAHGGLANVLACLFGVLLARLAATRLTRPPQ
jgi:F1F0 ATPase subunit 2